VRTNPSLVTHAASRKDAKNAERNRSGFPVVGAALSDYAAGMKFRVTIAPDEDGVFVAVCPDLPGCVSQGATRAEARLNIQDAIRGYLRSLEKHGEPVPGAITQETVDVAV
jgi:predicted RNase H-like HicB family nuclease